MLRKLGVILVALMLSTVTAQAAILDSDIGNYLDSDPGLRDSDRFTLSFDMSITDVRHGSGPEPFLRARLFGATPTRYPGALSDFFITPTEVRHRGTEGETSSYSHVFGTGINHIDIVVDFATTAVELFINSSLAFADNSVALSWLPGHVDNWMHFNLESFAGLGDRLAVDVTNLTLTSGPSTGGGTGGGGTNVPEPSLAGLLGIATIGMMILGRRRRSC